MNCSNCGSFNNGGKFCTRCGQSLENIQSTTIEQKEPLKQQTYTQPTSNMNLQNENNYQTINNTVSSNGATSNISISAYFFIIFAVIMKPFTAFKEEMNKFANFKNSAIVSLIVSVSATILNLITTMLNSVMIKGYDWTTGKYKTTWVWENIKKINYIQTIGKNFLIYLGIIIAIAVIYYIGGLIIKKQINFSRLLAVAAFSIIPMIICSLILSPLLALVWDELAMPIILIGSVYTVILLYEGINSELLLDGNAKYYFNLICLSILSIAAYYLYMKMFVGSVSGELEDIMDLFG